MQNCFGRKWSGYCPLVAKLLGCSAQCPPSAPVLKLPFLKFICMKLIQARLLFLIIIFLFYLHLFIFIIFYLQHSPLIVTSCIHARFPVGANSMRVAVGTMVYAVYTTLKLVSDSWLPSRQLRGKLRGK